MSEHNEYWVEEGPVDFTALQAQCRKEGYVSVAVGKEAFRVVFFEVPQTPQFERFREDSLVVAFGSNLTHLSAIISRETLEAYDTISDFCQDVVAQPWLVFRPDAEMAYAAHEVDRLLRRGNREDQLFQEIELDTVFLRAIDSLLSHKADLKTMIACEKRVSEPVGCAEFEVGFNTGYLMGRLISGHEFLNEFEQAAMDGFKLENDQTRRTKASGRKSSGDRDRRKQALLDKMIVISRDPSLQTPLKLEGLAEIAAKQCRAEDRDLWKKGYGQRNTYLDELTHDSSTSATIRQIRKNIRDI